MDDESIGVEHQLRSIGTIGNITSKTSKSTRELLPYHTNSFEPTIDEMVIIRAQSTYSLARSGIAIRVLGLLSV